MKQRRNFHDDLMRSERDAKLPCWLAWYSQVWPNIEELEFITNPRWQALGVDRAIHLGGGEPFVMVEEKLRDTVYEDIALEFVSNDVEGTPGWVEKPQQSEFIAYAFRATGECHLLPTRSLQAVWKESGGSWQSMFGVVSSENESRSLGSVHNTLSCPVPLDLLAKRLSGYRILRCDPALCLA